MQTPEMQKYCTITKHISEIKGASKDQRDVIKKQMQLCKCTLFEYLSECAIEKMYIPASANYPDLVLQMRSRKTQQKIDPTITCDAWKEIYNWSTLQPLLGQGMTLEDAICTALRDKIEELTTKKTPYVDVILKGSKGELQTDETQTGPTRTAPDHIGKTCIQLWQLKCDMKKLDKADKDAIGDMKKQLDDLAGKVMAQLPPGASQELSLDPDDESGVFLRTKVLAAAGKVNMKTLDKITKPIGALIRLNDKEVSLENAKIPPMPDITQLVAEAFKTASKEKEYKERLTIEQGPPKRQRT